VSETLTVLAVCVDCHYWLHYGWEEGANYREGYGGPEWLSEYLDRYTLDDLTTEEGEPLGPYYSSAQCLGCGSLLAGDRVTMAVSKRGERP
jgi:hypothetical protein